MPSFYRAGNKKTLMMFFASVLLRNIVSITRM